MLLPSCLYLAQQEQDDTIGYGALEMGLKTPTRLIQSAKSWLAHPSALYRERLLPLDAIDEQRRLSAVEVTTKLLTHMCEAWNQKMAAGVVEHMLQELDVVITIPASFDEVARALTLEAARAAGLQHVTLLEEPLAAMYAWLHQHPYQKLEVGSTILVCDVGGGTTDFSLLHVQDDGLHRTAVGRHLLLGGDNIDLALAHYVREKLSCELTASQWLSLLFQSRLAKEKLLNKQQQEYSIWIAAEGSSLIGGSLQATISAEEVHKLVLEGFFGLYDFQQAQTLTKNTAVRQMGLAYEADPSITKHLAHFLKHSGECAKPRYILFNGGTMTPVILQNRIEESLHRWFVDHHTPIEILKNSSLEMAVSWGAAATKLGERKIFSGLPRTFYLAVAIPEQKEEQALTLLARGAQPGASYSPEHSFSLRTNTHVQFSLYHSHTRLKDCSGDLIQIDSSELYRLPALQSRLNFGKQTDVEVRLKAYLTEIGTLALDLTTLDQSHSWNLEFTLQTDETAIRQDETLEQQVVQQISECVIESFGIGNVEQNQQLIPRLETLLNQKKTQWTCSILRTTFDALLKLEHKRKATANLASRFWNLAGFCLRPGIGHPLDVHRIKEMWKLILGDFASNPSKEVMLQQWICYRRLAAGLTKGQQTQLFHRMMQATTHDQYAYAEKIRGLASLERIESQLKIKLGLDLLKTLETGKGKPCDYWALARLGARKLLYGSLADVLSKQTCESWIERLLNMPQLDSQHGNFLLAALIHPIEQRSLDVSEKTVKRVKERIGEVELVWDQVQQERLFADSLPAGLVFQQKLS